jgi:hypothetical protein
VEPAASGHGEARECLFVASLCPNHEISVHATSVRCARTLRALTRYGASPGRNDSTIGGEIRR